MSKPIDRARELFEQMGHIADDEKCIELLAAALIHQPAGVAVPEAAGTMIKIAAALCTVALREIESAMDSPRLSRAHLENALVACKDRLGGYAIDLRRSADPHPVSGEQKPIGKVMSEEEMGIGWDRKSCQVIWFGKPAPGLIYAAPPAAQEPKSKLDALRKRFSDIEDEILAGKHNAQSVFTAMRTAALYIGQPAAQDVSGLVEISRMILDKLRNPTAAVHAGDKWKLEKALKPFEARRTQAQGGDV